MKKLFIILTTALALTLTACQTTDIKNQENPNLDFSSNGGKTLDKYWDAYFSSNDTAYLDKILDYTTTEDMFLKYMNTLLSEGKINSEDLEYLDIVNNNGILTSEYDTDLTTIFMIQYGDESTKYITYWLYSLLPNEILVRNSVKSSAYWSLGSVAEQMPAVKSYLISKFPELQSKTRKVFTDIYKIN